MDGEGSANESVFQIPHIWTSNYPTPLTRSVVIITIGSTLSSVQGRRVQRGGGDDNGSGDGPYVILLSNRGLTRRRGRRTSYVIAARVYFRSPYFATAFVYRVYR